MAPPAGRRSPAFLTAVFAVVAIAIGVSFVAYSLRPSPSPPTTNVVFSSVTLAEGNASFLVENVSGGPYDRAGFGATLIVNGFSNGPVELGPNNSVIRLTIGPDSYRIVWTDSNGDGRIDIGDSFSVSGDGVPLPSLSYYEFDLRWQLQWTAKATWSTP
jgi:hypothetical protein